MVGSMMFTGPRGGNLMRVRVALLAVPLVIMAACSSGTTSTGTRTAGTSASGSSSEAATLGPPVPPATVLAAPVAADRLPTAAGAFGEKPAITFPAAGPVPSLQRVILSAGAGPLTQSGDWLITNYLGQIWAGAVFDNSYDKATTAGFQIGVGAVVPGWDVALIGVPVGSRVMLTVPPADGYGAKGKTSAGISGADTLVFVVDIVQAVARDAAGQTDAAPQPAPAGGPQVTGPLGAAPTVTIPGGLAEPTAPTVAVLAAGTGAPVKNGQVLAQFVAVTWAGTSAGSTWPGAVSATGQPSPGPQQLPVAATGAFAGLAGVPLGSRVLVQIPAQKNTQTGKTQPAVAAAVDLLAQSS